MKNRVTPEVLLASFGLDKDPALSAIGAVVHFLERVSEAAELDSSREKAGIHRSAISVTERATALHR